MERIVRNAARCRKCGDELESENRHDFVTCSCGALSVDGGLDYLKRSGDPANCEELSEYTDEPETPKCTAPRTGSYGLLLKLFEEDENDRILGGKLSR
jgi:hypothetical protein